MIRNSPLVSIIVPSYNHESYLKQRIDSIIGQTFQEYEIILLDDCSVDNSATILLDYENQPQVSNIILNKTNSGSPFGMWQRGIEKAKGKYIWIAESDDFAEPIFLEQLVPVLDANEDVDLVYSDSKTIDEEGNILGFWGENKNSFFKTKRWSKNYQNNGIDEIVNYLFYKVTINNVSAVLFRKKALLKIDFSLLVNFKNVGDLYTYGIILLNSNIAYVSQPLNNYRLHPKNTTKKNTKSGIFYYDALLCYKYILDRIMTNPYCQTKKERIVKAVKFIINRFGFKLIDNGYGKELENFIRDLNRHNFISKLSTIKLLYLFKIYSFSTGEIKSIIKRIIKANL